MNDDFENSAARIIIQHFDESCDELWMRDTFSKYGKVIDIDIQRRKNGTKSDRAFLQFASKESVPLAIRGMNGKRQGDRIISVTAFEESNSEFRRVRKKQIFLQEEDFVGKEEGLEPPAYQRFPRRDNDAVFENTIKVPRPKTPPNPPENIIPAPPPYDPSFFQKEAIIPPMSEADKKAVFQGKSSEETSSDYESNSEDERIERSRRRREERHERHNRERDRDERKRREEKREHRSHHRDRERERDRDHDRDRERRSERRYR